MIRRPIPALALLLMCPHIAFTQVRERVSQPAAPPAVVTLEQFRSFAWIEGRWRGVGSGPLASVGVFYEEYARLNDSTMRMRTARDSTFATFIDSTTLALRGGNVSALPSRGTTRMVTYFSRDSIHWSGMSTIYVRLPGDRWRAVFPPRSPDAERPYYELQRVRD